MKQEDKDLLLTDLSARLPYGVWVKDIHTNIIRKLSNIVVYPLYDGNNIKDYICSIKMFDDHYVDIEYIRLFLYPLSSMTEEQKKEYTHIVNYISSDDTDNWKEGEFIYVEQLDQLMHFYHKNHLDYKGLIEKGLALDATGLNIY
jgi:hypothetical protein